MKTRVSTHIYNQLSKSNIRKILNRGKSKTRRKFNQFGQCQRPLSRCLCLFLKLNIEISVFGTGQTDCIWLVGINTFRCSILDQNVVLSQQRAQLTHQDVCRPVCTDNSAQADVITTTFWWPIYHPYSVGVVYRPSESGCDNICLCVGVVHRPSESGCDNICLCRVNCRGGI